MFPYQFLCACIVVVTCLGQVKADKANDHGRERSTSPDSTSTHSTLSEDLSEASHNVPAKIIEKSAPRGTDCTRNSKVNKPVLLPSTNAGNAVPDKKRM